MFLFFTTTTKLKIDNENESISETLIGDDEIEVVKAVPSLMIGKNHARIRCSLGKEHHIDNSNSQYPVPNYTTGSLASTFNCYLLDLREKILSTGIDLKKKGKVPNWKLNDLNFIQSNFPSKKKVITIKEKGILNLDWQIILQLIWLMKELIKKNLGISKKLAILRSQKNCDHSKYHNFIPSSWGKYIHDEIQKWLLLGRNNLIE